MQAGSQPYSRCHRGTKEELPLQLPGWPCSQPGALIPRDAIYHICSVGPLVRCPPLQSPWRPAGLKPRPIQALMPCHATLCPATKSCQPRAVAPCGVPAINAAFPSPSPPSPPCCSDCQAARSPLSALPLLLRVQRVPCPLKPPWVGLPSAPPGSSAAASAVAACLVKTAAFLWTHHHHCHPCYCCRHPPSHPLMLVMPCSVTP